MYRQDVSLQQTLKAEVFIASEKQIPSSPAKHPGAYVKNYWNLLIKHTRAQRNTHIYIRDVHLLPIVRCMPNLPPPPTVFTHNSYIMQTSQENCHKVPLCDEWRLTSGVLLFASAPIFMARNAKKHNGKSILVFHHSFLSLSSWRKHAY